FFLSSRRRHTRWKRDWSSDVCSSDLKVGGQGAVKRQLPVEVCQLFGGGQLPKHQQIGGLLKAEPAAVDKAVHDVLDGIAPVEQRSEERRVWRERRAEWVWEGDQIVVA